MYLHLIFFLGNIRRFFFLCFRGLNALQMLRNVRILVSFAIWRFEFLFFAVGHDVEPLFSALVFGFVNVTVLNNTIEEKNHFSYVELEPVLVYLQCFWNFWRIMYVLKVFVDLFLSNNSVGHDFGNLSYGSGFIIHLLGLFERLEFLLNGW